MNSVNNTSVFKQSLILLRDNIMITQPMFLWILLMMFVVQPLFSRSSIDLFFILNVITVLLCSSAFIAGWYNSVKFTVSLNNKTYVDAEERRATQVEILKKFIPGVGEYILPVTVLCILYALLIVGCSYLFHLFAEKAFLYANIPHELISLLNSGTPEQLQTFIQNGLSTHQLAVISAVSLIGILSIALFWLVVLWFGPTLLFTTKNPFKAVWLAVKFLFSNFKISLAIILVMFTINLCISGINMICGNTLFSFIPFLLFFFYVTFYVLTVFLYYEQKTQTDCNHGFECNG